MADGFESPAFASPKSNERAITETQSYTRSRQLLDTQKPHYSIVHEPQPNTSSNRMIPDNSTRKLRLRLPSCADREDESADHLPSKEVGEKRQFADPMKKIRMLNLSPIERDSSQQSPSFRFPTPIMKATEPIHTETQASKTDYSFENKDSFFNNTINTTLQGRKESFGVNYGLFERVSANSRPSPLAKYQSAWLLQKTQERTQPPQNRQEEPRQKPEKEQVQEDVYSPEARQIDPAPKNERSTISALHREENLPRRSESHRYLLQEPPTDVSREHLADSNLKLRRSFLQTENIRPDAEVQPQPYESQRDLQKRDSLAPSSRRQPQSYRSSSPFQRVHMKLLDFDDDSRRNVPSRSQRDAPEKETTNSFISENKNTQPADSFTDNSALVKRAEALKQGILESKKNFTEELQGLNSKLQQRISIPSSITPNNIQVEKQDTKKADSFLTTSAGKRYTTPEKPDEQGSTIYCGRYESELPNNDSTQPKNESGILEPSSKRTTDTDELAMKSLISGVRLQPPILRPKSNPRMGPSLERTEEPSHRYGSNLRASLRIQHDNTTPKNYFNSGRAENISSQESRPFKLLHNNINYFSGNRDDDSNKKLSNAAEPTDADSSFVSTRQYQRQMEPERESSGLKSFKTNRENLAIPMDNYPSKLTGGAQGVHYEESFRSSATTGRVTKGYRASSASYRFLINKENNNAGGTQDETEAIRRARQPYRSQHTANLQEPSENIRKIEEILKQFRSHIQ